MPNALIDINQAIFTPEEYIAFEEQSDIKHEFDNGKLRPIPGTTDQHNNIALNCAFILRQNLKGKGCSTFMESVKLQVNPTRYTYPDVFVCCDERDTNDHYIKRYPVLIIEVLSPTTRFYDLTDKFIQYRNIDTLQYYIAIDTEKVFAQCFLRKENNDWEVGIYTDLNETIELPNLNMSILLTDAYQTN
jgi:Uma2 family endonuclease